MKLGFSPRNFFLIGCTIALCACGYKGPLITPEQAEKNQAEKSETAASNADTNTQQEEQ